MAMEIPASMQALKSKDIWIGDTGAIAITVHSPLRECTTYHTNQWQLCQLLEQLTIKHKLEINVKACNKNGM